MRPVDLIRAVLVVLIQVNALAAGWEDAARTAVFAGDWPTVLRAVKDQRGLSPANPVAEWLSAHAAVAVGDYGVAAESFGRLGGDGSARSLRTWAEEWLGPKGESPGTLLLLGDAYAREGLHEQSLAKLNRAVAMSPRWPSAWNARGVVHALSGQNSAAAADFEEAISADGGFADAYANRGLLFLSAGRPQEAIESFTMALDRAARHPTASHARAIAQAQIGEWDRAVADFDAAGTELAGLKWTQTNRNKVDQARVAHPDVERSELHAASGVLSVAPSDGIGSAGHSAIAEVMSDIRGKTSWTKPLIGMTSGVTKDALNGGLWGFQTGARFQEAAHLDKATGISGLAFSNHWEAGRQSSVDGLKLLLNARFKPQEIGTRLYFDGIRFDKTGQGSFLFDKPVYGVTGKTAAFSFLDAVPSMAKGMDSQLSRGSWTPNIMEIDHYAQAVTNASSAFLGKVAWVRTYTYTFGSTLGLAGAGGAHRIAYGTATAVDMVTTNTIRAASAQVKQASQPFFDSMFMGGVRQNLAQNSRVLAASATARGLPTPGPHTLKSNEGLQQWIGSLKSPPQPAKTQKFLLDVPGVDWEGGSRHNDWGGLLGADKVTIHVRHEGPGPDRWSDAPGTVVVTLPNKWDKATADKMLLPRLRDAYGSGKDVHVVIDKNITLARHMAPLPKPGEDLWSAHVADYTASNTPSEYGGTLAMHSRGTTTIKWLQAETIQRMDKVIISSPRGDDSLSWIKRVPNPPPTDIITARSDAPSWRWTERLGSIIKEYPNTRIIQRQDIPAGRGPIEIAARTHSSLQDLGAHGDWKILTGAGSEQFSGPLGQVWQSTDRPLARTGPPPMPAAGPSGTILGAPPVREIERRSLIVGDTNRSALAAMGGGLCPGGSPPPCGGGGGGAGARLATPRMPEMTRLPEANRLPQTLQYGMTGTRMPVMPAMGMERPKGVLMGVKVVQRQKANFSAMFGGQAAGTEEPESFYVPFLLFSALDGGR